MLTAPGVFCFLMGIAYCTAFSASSSSSRRARFNYRNLKADDIKEVAELCADCFDGPFGLVQFLQREMLSRISVIRLSLDIETSS